MPYISRGFQAAAANICNDTFSIKFCDKRNAIFVSSSLLIIVIFLSSHTFYIVAPHHSGPKGGIIEKLTDPESEMVVKYPTQIYLP